MATAEPKSGERPITAPLAWYPRLSHATDVQRTNRKIAGACYRVHWPEVDEDLGTPGLLQGAPAPHGGTRAAA